MKNDESLPVPPPHVDWPAERKLPDDDVLVNSVGVPRLDGVIDDADEGVFHGACECGVERRIKLINI